MSKPVDQGFAGSPHLSTAANTVSPRNAGTPKRPRDTDDSPRSPLTSDSISQLSPLKIYRPVAEGTQLSPVIHPRYSIGTYSPANDAVNVVRNLRFKNSPQHAHLKNTKHKNLCHSFDLTGFVQENENSTPLGSKSIQKNSAISSLFKHDPPRETTLSPPAYIQVLSLLEDKQPASLLSLWVFDSKRNDSEKKSILETADAFFYGLTTNDYKGLCCAIPASSVAA